MPTINIGDKSFEVNRFNLNDIINVNEKVGDIRNIPKKENFGEQLKDIRYIIWYALKKKDKGITEEQVGEMIPVNGFDTLLTEFFRAIDITANPTQAPKK